MHVNRRGEGLAVMLSQIVGAPVSLMSFTVKAPSLIAVERAAVAEVQAKVAARMVGVLTSMIFTKQNGPGGRLAVA